MILEHEITEIYFIICEFYKKFDKVIKEHTLEDGKKRKWNRKFTLSQCDVVIILVLFHSGAFKNLKSFYIFYVQKHMKKEFPHTVSYNRFIELQRKACIPPWPYFLKCSA